MIEVSATARVHEQETWLSVQDASAMLGVSPATLRRWSAAGEVEAFTTPGGHRRFALTTLRALLPQPEDAAVPAVLGESRERMVRVLQRRTRTVGESAWLRSLPEADRDALRAIGCEVTEAIVEHLDATDRATKRAALARAERGGEAQGRLAASLGAPLADLVEVFLQFRSQFITELGSAAVRHGLDSAGATTLVTRGGEVLDRVLAAAVASYEAAQRSRGPASR